MSSALSVDPSERTTSGGSVKRNIKNELKTCSLLKFLKIYFHNFSSSFLYTFQLFNEKKNVLLLAECEEKRKKAP